MIVEKMDGYWQASGDGRLRPIVTEGTTRKEAVLRWMGVFIRQHHELSHHLEKKREDYRQMAAEARNYKGTR